MASFLRTSSKTLILLAGIVWYVGGLMLFRGGLELLLQALELRAWSAWHSAFLAAGILLGIVQALTIFNRSCRKNIQRIRNLEEPRLWQFFRPGFFLALAVMIASGIALDHFARGNYFFMLAVASLDFALTISLLGSSYVFWTDRALPAIAHGGGGSNERQEEQES